MRLRNRPRVQVTRSPREATSAGWGWGRWCARGRASHLIQAFSVNSQVFTSPWESGTISLEDLGLSIKVSINALSFKM